MSKDRWYDGFIRTFITRSKLEVECTNATDFE